MKKKLLTFSLLSLLAIGLGTSTASADIHEQIVDEVKKGTSIDDIFAKYPQHSDIISRLAINDINGRAGVGRNFTSSLVNKKMQKNGDWVKKLSLDWFKF